MTAKTPINAQSTTLSAERKQALQLDKQLCFAMYSTSLLMTKMYKPMLEALGLTYPQYLVMLILWEKDGVALKDIGEQLHIDSGALTPVIKRMEVMGLLTRRRMPENERTLEICLTAAGWALQPAASDVNQRLGIQCGMAEPEITALRQQLTALRSRLQQQL
ncbi:MAG: MarR family transcriptional regulator [Gammaproteobacteria bacterium]|jgi:MarR family transcriptional regulator, organic hydroperoxide resistance regulator|nr:MarR family transcriptional regulator [Gammaproteobacteria bacterium]MBU2224989.1 MarR family transcriptional regulator [Gammaproteobacteria bacterium]MBU2280181.1 MarR family transcriptional regulator [Gammaproteobacteria bacterium]MBU2428892.1 MarR family transcriptional regulator [Gammaproteobacteria bacterium]